MDHAVGRCDEQSSSLAPAPHRCFVADALTEALTQKQKQSPKMVRLMGTVVSMKEFFANQGDDTCNDNDGTATERTGSCYYDDPPQADFMLLELDDGTGNIVCLTPMATMDRLSLKVGQVIDCIGRLQPALLADNTQTQTLVLEVDTLLEVRGDLSVAERLRWMEITQAPQLKSSSYKYNDNSGAVLFQGYPCPEISSDDILAIIESNADEGVKLSDLALVMDIEESHAKTLIEDLQLQGVIYENKKGLFVPL